MCTAQYCLRWLRRVTGWERALRTLRTGARIYRFHAHFWMIIPWHPATCTIVIWGQHFLTQAMHGACLTAVKPTSESRAYGCVATSLVAHLTGKRLCNRLTHLAAIAVVEVRKHICRFSLQLTSLFERRKSCAMSAAVLIALLTCESVRASARVTNSRRPTFPETATNLWKCGTSSQWCLFCWFWGVLATR